MARRKSEPVVWRKQSRKFKLPESKYYMSAKEGRIQEHNLSREEAELYLGTDIRIIVQGDTLHVPVKKSLSAVPKIKGSILPTPMKEQVATAA